MIKIGDQRVFSILITCLQNHLPLWAASEQRLFLTIRFIRKSRQSPSAHWFQPSLLPTRIAKNPKISLATSQLGLSRFSGPPPSAISEKKSKAQKHLQVDAMLRSGFERKTTTVTIPRFVFSPVFRILYSPVWDEEIDSSSERNWKAYDLTKDRCWIRVRLNEANLYL